MRDTRHRPARRRRDARGGSPFPTTGLPSPVSETAPTHEAPSRRVRHRPIVNAERRRRPAQAAAPGSSAAGTASAADRLPRAACCTSASATAIGRLAQQDVLQERDAHRRPPAGSRPPPCSTAFNCSCASGDHARDAAGQRRDGRVAARPDRRASRRCARTRDAPPGSRCARPAARECRCASASFCGAALPLDLQRQRVGGLQIVGIQLQRPPPVPHAPRQDCRGGSRRVPAAAGSAALSGASAAARASCCAPCSSSCCRSSSSPRFAHPAGSCGTSATTRSNFCRASTSCVVCIADRPM